MNRPQKSIMNLSQANLSHLSPSSPCARLGRFLILARGEEKSEVKCGSIARGFSFVFFFFSWCFYGVFWFWFLVLVFGFGFRVLGYGSGSGSGSGS